MRAAERLGGHDLAIAKARVAVTKRAGNAKTLLDAVPAAARTDPGYIFSRAEWLRGKGHGKEADALMHGAPNDPARLVDVDQWWKERRILVRSLLDEGEARAAYQVARDTPQPPQQNFGVDQHFTAGIGYRPAARVEHVVFIAAPRRAALQLRRMAQAAGHGVLAAVAGGYREARAEFDAEERLWGFCSRGSVGEREQHEGCAEQVTE